jgi:lipopolysaccharide export system permease protein
MKIESLNRALAGLRRKNQNLDGQKQFMTSVQENSDKFSIEFHKKFALTTTIIVLFFVGAPLGAIVRKGGFGAPVVIAALLFMVYFVLFTVGEGLAKEGVVIPFVGMWMPTLVLTPIACLLMISAANDLKISDPKLWRLIFSFGKRR